MSVARALVRKFSQHAVQRLIAPGDFVTRSAFEPDASEIRRWAYNSAVDTIVVGRVYRQKTTGQSGPRVVETIVRSGHSGGELFRRDVVVAREGDLDRKIGELAASILYGLSHADEAPPEGSQSSPPMPPSPATPVVSANAAGTPSSRPSDADADADSRGHGLSVATSKSEFRRDAPIEIKAEEAEIIRREEGRKLIFHRNVRVRQDNVTLRSDRLEALYRRGESEPRELIAEGRVVIVQNDRRAECDRAVYLRESSRLTCSGHAQLTQGCDIIRGERIEFDLSGDRARVEGAASIVIQPKGESPADCAVSRGKI